MLINRSTFRYYIFCTLLVALAGVTGYLAVRLPAVPFRLSVVSFLLFCTVCLLELIRFQKNMPDRRSRFCCSVILLLLILWLFLEHWQNLFEYLTGFGMHVVWYLTYIPTTLIPNSFLFFALSQGKEKYKKMHPLWYLTAAVSLVLLTGILTNDLHELAFRILPDGKTYEYGYWYYLTMAWSLGLLAAGVLVIRRRAGHTPGRGKIWIYALIFGTALLYFGWWMAGKPFIPWFDYVFDLSEIWVLLMLAAIECGIYYGFIRTNCNYAELFEASAFSMVIADSDGLRYSTRNHVMEVGPEKFSEAAKGEALLDKDHMLRSRPIRGGRVYWLQDVGTVNKLHEQLRETRSRIDQENSLLKAENELRARNARAEEQTTLYGMMSRRVAPQLKRVEELLSGLTPESPELHARLSEACVYKAYIKRYCNLCLLSGENRLLPLYELRNSIAEAQNYLKLYGVTTALAAQTGGAFRPELLIWAFYVYQLCVEAALSALKSLSVRIKAEDNVLYMAVEAEGEGLNALASHVREEGLKQAALRDSLIVQPQENGLKAQLFGWGGEEA